MTDKVQKIIEEIERRINVCEKYSQLNLTESTRIGNHAQLLELRELKVFIDSLQEEPSKDLEEELDDFLKDPVFGKLINRNAGLALVRHFAEWQKQKDKESSCEVNCTAKNEDLEKELSLWMKEHSDEGGFFNLLELANHFAEWQREKDNKMYAHIPLKEIHCAWQTLKKNKPDIEKYPAVCFMKGADWRENQMKETLQTEYEKGLFDMREEIMKDAVGTIIVNDWQYGKDPDHAIIPAIHQRIDGFDAGDKVKIIIVKED